MELIRSKKGFDDFNQVLHFCVHKTGIDLGIESWQFVMLVVRVLMHDLKKDQLIVNVVVMLEQFTYANMFTMLGVELEGFVTVKISILEKNHEPSWIITI